MAEDGRHVTVVQLTHKASDPESVAYQLESGSEVLSLDDGSFRVYETEEILTPYLGSDPIK